MELAESEPSLKVLHAPRNIANQSWESAQGLRLHGVDAEVWQYGDNRFGFPCDRLVDLDSGPVPVVEAFLDAVNADFDVLHFHFSRTLFSPRGGLLEYWDLPIWRALGKKLVFSFHGSDVRLKSRHMEEDEWSYFRFSDIEPDEGLMQQRIRTISAYADALLVGDVPLLPYVPRSIYMPKAIETALYPVVPPAGSRRPRIVHVPSRRGTKGTEFILRGIDALRSRGHDFEFVLAENRSHEEVKELYQGADIVIVKLLGDGVGTSALEAMAMGKVAVTRARDEVLARHPGLPIVNVNPDTFVDRMEDLFSTANLAELGIRGRRFVESNHDIRLIGAALLDLYESITPRKGTPRWRYGSEAQIERLLERRELEAVRLRQTETRLKDRLAVTKKNFERQKERAEDLSRRLSTEQRSGDESQDVQYRQRLRAAVTRLQRWVSRKNLPKQD